MYTTTTAATTSISTKIIVTKEILPIWGTEYEINQKKYLRSSSSNIFHDNSIVPSSSSSNDNLYIPAEHEPISAVIITYPDYDSFKELKTKLSMAITNTGVEVWMIGRSAPQIPDNDESIQNKELYKTINSIDIDSTWVRDYGPIIGRNTLDNNIDIIDTTYRWYYARKGDDLMPCKISDLIQTSISPSPSSISCVHVPGLVFDGGNILFDGNGNFFMTDRTYDWNFHLTKDEVDEQIQFYFGIHTIHSLEYALAPTGNKFYKGADSKEPADGTGHIDMFIKILSPCVVLIAQTDYNDDTIMYESLEKANAYFEHLSCPASSTTTGAGAGTGYYEIYRICGWYDTINSTWYTYTNSLIINDVVIIPSYNDILQYKCNDEIAINVYKDAMPHIKEIVSINTDDSIKYGGSIHCLTRDIPKF